MTNLEIKIGIIYYACIIFFKNYYVFEDCLILMAISSKPELKIHSFILILSNFAILVVPIIVKIQRDLYYFSDLNVLRKQLCFLELNKEYCVCLKNALTLEMG